MIPDWVSFFAGILIATVVSTVGIGGGILWVPYLLVGLSMPPENAVVTSLLIQTAGKASGSVAYLRQKAVDRPLAWFVLAVAVPGVGLGAYLSSRFSAFSMQLILGILVMVTAFLFVSLPSAYNDAGVERVNVRRAAPFLWPTTLVVSVGAGLLSTGLGEWLVPIMRARLSLAMRNAIATCIFVTFGVSVMGAAFHLAVGSVPNLTVVAYAVPGVLIGGQIGPRISRRIDEHLLKEVFIFLLTLIGIHIIYNAF